MNIEISKQKSDRQLNTNEYKIYYMEIIMEETDFPTNNCISEKEIRQLRQVLKKKRYIRSCTFTAPKSSF